MTVAERDSLFFEALPLAKGAARSLCCRLLIRGADADDAEQEAALAALLAASRFNPGHERSHWQNYTKRHIWGALKDWLHRRPLLHPTRHNRQSSPHLCLRGEKAEEVLQFVAAPRDSYGEFLDTVLDAVKRLPAGHQEVITKRFGLDGLGERTLAELGQEAGGLTREAIRQREKKALARLRGGLEV